MKKVINLRKVLDFLIIMIVPFLIIPLYDKSIISSYYAYFIYIMIIIIDLMIERRIIFTKKMIPTYILSTIIYIIIPFCLGHINSVFTFTYLIGLILFLFVCDIIGSRLVTNSKGIIIWWAILGTICIDIQVVNNIREINSLTMMNSFFGTGTRNRAFLGFNHPNATAMVIVFLIIIYYFIIKYMKLDLSYKKRLLLIILMVFNFIALISTNSRTAIFCLLIFLLFNFVLNYIKSINNRKIRFLIILFITLISMIVINKINYNEIIISSSGRDTTIINSINKMKESGSLWFGVGASNISNSRLILSNYGIKSTDNWYFMQMVRFGMIGLLSFCLLLLSIIIQLFRSRKIVDKNYSISLLFMILLYGLGENVIYNQAIILSLIVWSFVNKSFREQIE